MAKIATTSANQHPVPNQSPGRYLKNRLRGNDVLIGGMITEYLRPSLIKYYCQAGFDFVYIEYEHTFFNASDLIDTVLCARDNGLPVIAKTPQLERAEVAKLLECGVVGIQLPRTESREQVETLQSYLKFPPHGTRAVAPGWGNSSYLVPTDWKAWMSDQDEETTVVLHIETRLGYENAEQIISTPGVDMVYVGPGDFSVEMGHPGDYDHPDVAGPMQEIFAICRKHNVPYGTTPSSVEAARGLVAEGASFFEAVDELTLILEGASRMIREIRGDDSPVANIKR